ncbi:MAG TPA: hypothetical protein PKI32_03815 [Opitutales bacterium]|nr:hypothetical protein [Opitutales bacterium]
MEIAPAIVMIPALYLFFRPPLGVRAILVSVALSLLVWLPYLRFEAGREFADLRSLVLVSPVEGDHRAEAQLSDPSHHIVRAWDVPRLRAERTGQSPESLVDDGNFWLWSREWGWIWAERKVVRYLGEDGFIFYCNKRAEWLFQSFESGRILKTDGKAWEPGRFLVDYPGRETKSLPGKSDWRITRERLKTAGPLVYLGEQQSFGLWLWQTLLFAVALALVIWKGAILRLPSRAFVLWKGLFRKDATRAELAAPGNTAFRAVLVLGWILPVAVFLCLVGWEGFWQNQRRFMWLWSVQATILAAGLSLPLWKGWRPGVILALAAAVTLSTNPLTKTVFADAFSASPGHFLRKEDRAIDAISSAVRAEGRTSARIGYDTNQLEWFVQLRGVDGISKCGIDWDVSLFLRHGITNLDTSVEGLSADDDFRVYSPLYNIPHTDFAQNRWSMTVDGSIPEM